jgi:mannosyltransferase OCH1-like enzyme
MDKIPQIIHQTWKDSNLPYPFNILADTWKEAHPNWEYQLWTDKMNRSFIEENYPEFLNKYNNYPREIQRVDAFRYFLLHKIGGIYIDIDFECLNNISPLLAEKGCVIGKEPQQHSDRFFKEMILCNAFMASTPGNDFMRFVCNKIMSYPSKETVTQKEVLESTGPFILTDAFIKYKHKENIRILEPDVLYPLTMTETRNVFDDSITDEMQEKINHAYAVHYFWGGW